MTQDQRIEHMVIEICDTICRFDPGTIDRIVVQDCTIKLVPRSPTMTIANKNITAGFLALAAILVKEDFVIVKIGTANDTILSIRPRAGYEKDFEDAICRLKEKLIDGRD